MPPSTSSKNLCRIALMLWIAGAGILGLLFVKGVTTPSADGRTVVHLAPAERDLVLTEIRQLLQAVHGIVTGVSQLDQARDALRRQRPPARRGWW